MQKNAVVIGSVAVSALIAAGAGAYFAGANTTPQRPVHTASAPPLQQQAQLQPQKPACNDNNIVGTGLGAVAGGVVGSQIGKGSGKTAATIGGAVVGGVAGHELIPTQNVTCR